MSASHARALEQLRALCAEAENSSIHALGRFAHRLPTYVTGGQVRLMRRHEASDHLGEAGSEPF
jgi:hypothetical protein